MIIEFFGLPGSGKSTLARAVQEKMTATHLLSDSSSRIRALWYVVRHPLTAVFLMYRSWEQTAIITTGRYQLFYYKLALLRSWFARCAHAESQSGAVWIADEGLWQKILSIYETHLTEVEWNTLLRWVHRPSQLVLVPEIDTGVFFKRYEHDPEHIRYRLGQDYRDNLYQVFKHNVAFISARLAQTGVVQASCRTATEAVEKITDVRSKPRVLFITQAVDPEDRVLGFVVHWLQSLRSRLQLHVVCLKKGSGVPHDMHIMSLGKEQKKSRLQYVLRLGYAVWHERNTYETVFVHMNPIYIVLCGWFWKLQKKRIILWYNHRDANWLAKVAYVLSDQLLYTSQFSYFAGKKNTYIMSAGIDTELFTGDCVSRVPQRWLCVGRISQIKRPELIIKAVEHLISLGQPITLDVLGDRTDRESAYYDDIKKLISGCSGIRLLPGVPNEQLPAIYAQYDGVINATVSGSLDKTILEAMACGRVVCAANRSLLEILSAPFSFTEDSQESLEAALSAIGTASEETIAHQTAQTQMYVRQMHSLSSLVEQITTRICAH